MRGTLGIDVSEANASVDWGLVHGAGYRFAVAKVSEGDYTDPMFSAKRVAAIRKAGLIAGGYVYLRPKPGRSGGDEALHFLRLAKRAGLWAADGQRVVDVRPVLDVEQTAFRFRARSRTLRYVEDAVRTTMRHTGGRHPILYLGSFWRDEMRDPRSSVLEGCPLWYPEYGVSEPRQAPAANWPHGPSIWQYSESGRVPGVHDSCDLDRYMGPDGLRGFRKRLCI